jgi:hypothetical protein
MIFVLLLGMDNLECIIVHAFQEPNCGDTHMTAHSLPQCSYPPHPNKASITVSALLQRKWPFPTAPAPGLMQQGHAYQICQLTNGRVGWPAGTCIKEGCLACEDSFVQCQRQAEHQEKSASSKVVTCLEPKE